MPKTQRRRGPPTVTPPEGSTAAVRVACLLDPGLKTWLDQWSQHHDRTLSQEFGRALRRYREQETHPPIETSHYGRQAGALARLTAELMRPPVAAAGLSLHGNWAGENPAVGAAAFFEVTRFFTAMRPDVPLDDAVEGLLEGGPPYQAAADLVFQLFDESDGYSAQWRNSMREDLGPELTARGIELRRRVRDRISERREKTSGKSPAPNRAVQGSWGDAVMLAKDQGIKAEIATAHSQIAHLGQLPKAERLAAIKDKRRQILTWAGLDPAVRADLLAALDCSVAAGDDAG